MKRSLGIAILALVALASAARAQGAFAPVFAWPLIPIHTSLLPDGRVLAYGTDGSGNQTGQFIYDVWDPVAHYFNPNSEHLVLANTTGTDIFCSTQTLLSATGDLLITGGDITQNGLPRGNGNAQTNTFDPSTDDLQPDGQMAFRRWYASLVALPDERAVIFGGRSTLAGTVDGVAPEIYDPTARSWSTLSGAASTDAFGVDNQNWFYPRAYVIPGGAILILTNQGALYSVDVNAGTTTLLPQTIPPGLPYLPAVEYAPGHILAIRGGGEAITIDTTTNPWSIADTDPVDPNRWWSSMSIMPDGRLLLTGGAGTWFSDARDLDTAQYQALIWDPSTGHWTPDATAALARLYHSNSLVLADASVLVAGGGSPGALNNLNAEIYWPSYLFAPDGSPAPRPSLYWTTADTAVGGYVWGNTDFDSNITRIMLLRAGSATHSNNSDQRPIELPVNNNFFDGNLHQVYAELPNDNTVVIPGYYMMFAFNDAGVPSLGQVVHIHQ